MISWPIVSQSGLPTKRESQLHYAFEDGLQAAEEGERVGVLAVVNSSSISRTVASSTNTSSVHAGARSSNHA